mmetsp:Transcript_4467/g.13497  ORF Transcript_4467/g.13497 Transcript_4467/m.13497 type:complete len:211 (+) Transcript_4467:1572-2204(+)
MSAGKRAAPRTTKGVPLRSRAPKAARERLEAATSSAGSSDGERSKRSLRTTLHHDLSPARTEAATAPRAAADELPTNTPGAAASSSHARLEPQRGHAGRGSAPLSGSAPLRDGRQVNRSAFPQSTSAASVTPSVSARAGPAAPGEASYRAVSHGPGPAGRVAFALATAATRSCCWPRSATAGTRRTLHAVVVPPCTSVLPEQPIRRRASH